MLLVCCFLSVLHAHAQDTAATMRYDPVAPEPERMYPRFPGYPKFKPGLQPLAYFIPRKWTVRDSLRGDLDGDGLADLAVVLQYLDTVVEQRPDGGDWEAQPRVLLILFRDRHTHRYRLALQNNKIIPRSGEGRRGGDPYNSLRLEKKELTLSGPMGGEYNFRWRNGDMYLVSAWTNGEIAADPPTNDEGEHQYDTFYYYHFNYLTGAVLSRKSLMDGGNSDKEWVRRFHLPKKPLVSLRRLELFDERKLFRPMI